jgi:hypothetical protein
MAGSIATLVAVTAAAVTVAAVSSSTTCNSSSFNVSLTNIQCYGLSNDPGVRTQEDCVAFCCANPACVAWEFCPPGETCSGYAGPSCWAGATDLTKCDPGQGWVGGGRATPTPSPLRPQVFLPPLSPASAPLASVDLGSSSGSGGAMSWTAAVDGAAPRSILVPAGGYNSDQQEPPLINAYDGVLAGVALTATLPPLPTLPTPLPAGGVVWVLELGACNHGCEVYLSSPTNASAPPSLVGVHHGPNMAFAVDVTEVLAPALPAASSSSSSSPAPLPVQLTVLARPFSFFGGNVPSTFRYPEVWTHPSGGFASRTPGGISKYIRLSAVPAVRISDVITRASVAAQTLTILVELTNAMAVDDAVVSLTGLLGSWNFGSSPPPWTYPDVPASGPVTVPARTANVTVTLTVPWSALGPASWWWPNRPYDAAYRPQLHWINLTASVTVSGGRGAATGADPAAATPVVASHRFGFVEHAEGGPFYYTLNGVRVNQLSDATPEQGMSSYDAYVSPAFATPDAARDSWGRYLTLGLTSNRIHQSTPTQVMLDAADEVGFLLKPESPSRGCFGYEPCNATSPVFPQSVSELVRWSRGHPSVSAYSVENEAGDRPYILPLVDAAFATDPTRPLTTEGSGGELVYNGSLPGAHAINYLHYQVPSQGATSIRAVGECAWCVANGLESYSSLALAGRLDDVAYYAGWDMLNYWSNFLLGMNASEHAWTQVPCQGRDRVDGPAGDGWGSPVVTWVQRAFHPFLVAAPAVVAAHPIFDGPGWPYGPVANATYTSGTGTTIPLTLSLFNDALASTFTPWLGAGNPLSGELALNWTSVWDDPQGSDVAGAGSLGPWAVAPGFQKNVSLAVPVPDPGAGAQGRSLYLVLTSYRPAVPGTALYVEDRMYAAVSSS